ncbi:ROK family protein [Ktedonospora formicarum]|uniref:Transcriptional regulator n=1 Tax=Ktedonospora formicarum TaxID=2778364 RepID=A0A8J3IBK7_9CHLR|nr:ROK family protein [Ktedonospora formicarum]GHO50971.1 transcriptional regulator [Ktedonospora formicarum]
MGTRPRTNGHYGGTSLKGLRRNNRGFVYRAIWDLKRVSRAELASVTGLHPATITHIVDELLADNMIVEVGSADPTIGRPRLQLQVHAEVAYVVGVSMTREAVSAALIDLGGAVSEVIQIDGLDLAEKQEYTVNRLRQAIEMLLEGAASTGRNVIGIGIGFPGPVDPATGQTYLTEAKGIREPLSFYLGARLAEYFKHPLYIDNDSNALALAEQYFGECHNVHDFVCINCGIGIGAGIVCNGDVYYGPYGNAGEIGHNVVDIDGVECVCGNRGCLTCYASIPAIIEQVATVLPHYPEPPTLNYIATLYREGHERVIEVVDRISRYLGLSIINIVNTLAPEVVVLSSHLEQLAPIIAQNIQVQMRHNLASPMHEHTQIVSSRLKYASLQGSAMLVIRQIYTSGSFHIHSDAALSSTK